MVTYHGTTVKLVIERLTAEGKIAQEYIGTLSGGAVDQTFYTKNFPITTGAGVTTDAETEVDVFTNDGTLGSWSEYLDDGSDFEITGATGAVLIKAAENQGGNAGERISISYYTTAEVAVGQSAEVNWEGDLTDIHKLGSVLPQELKEGPVTIGGTIGQLYAKKLADFSFYIYLDAPEGVIQSGSPYIKVANTKFGGGSLSVDVAGITALNVDYKGLALSQGLYP
jgi:hypothetical protein